MTVAVPPEGVATGDDGVARCWWCVDDPLYIDYHDNEWGRPVTDDRALFERISLEAFQAGLSWLTILRKRRGFRSAFAEFDPETVAGYGQRDVERLLANPEIVRHKAKIEATINNARRCLDLIEEAGSLATHLWSYRPANGERPESFDWDQLVELGVAPQAHALSEDLKARGWRYVGATTMYSLMESAGIVNDHVRACDLRNAVEEDQRRAASAIARAGS